MIDVLIRQRRPKQSPRPASRRVPEHESARLLRHSLRERLASLDPGRAALLRHRSAYAPASPRLA